MKPLQERIEELFVILHIVSSVKYDAYNATFNDITGCLHYTQKMIVNSSAMKNEKNCHFLKSQKWNSKGSIIEFMMFHITSYKYTWQGMIDNKQLA